MALLKTVIFTVFVPGTVTVLVPYLLLSSPARFTANIGAFRWLGLAPGLLGLLGYLWCAWDFVRAQGTPLPLDPPKELVVRGLYRFTRNPMYVSVLLVLLGEAVLFLSLGLLIYAALVFLGFHMFVFYYEEPTLRRKFGEAYARYCDKAPRWILKVR